MNNRVHQGHLARKRFGQNFLNDQFVIDSIVSAINPQKGQAMVEIGPGLAALTEPVGERLDQLTVIELDRDLAARLQTHPFLGPKLTIYQQDAMTFNFGELAEKMGQPLRVFGNLPYNISTPLMFHLFSYTDAIADMHFMLQKEVESSGCRTEQQSVWSIKRYGAILLQRDPSAGSTAVSLYTTTQSGFRRRAPGSSCNDASPG